MDGLGELEHSVHELAAGELVLTQAQLWNLIVLLQTACGRNHSSLTKARRQYFCLLQRNLRVQADLRGLPQPPAQVGVGDVIHDPDAPYVA